MEITDIKIRKTFDTEPLKAVVSVTLEQAVAIHDIKIIHAKDKLFVVMPSKKMQDGTYRDIVHPITAQFREQLEGALIAKYEEHLRDGEPPAPLL